MIDLTTLDSFKAYAGVAGYNDDAAISALITAYSGWVREYCNRDFTVQSYASTFDGRNNTRQMLDQWPIVSVASVRIDAQTITAQADIGQLGYRFDLRTIILDGYRFTRGNGNVAISWTAGYATVPAALAQAVNELVGLRYELRDKQGWSSKGLAGETVSLITRDMPASVKTYLDGISSKVSI